MSMLISLNSDIYYMDIGAGSTVIIMPAMRKQCNDVPADCTAVQ